MKLYITREKEPPCWTIYWNLVIPELGDTSYIEQEYQIRNWCNEIYGSPGLRWHDYIWNNEIRFFKKKDADWFLLKWSYHEF